VVREPDGIDLPATDPPVDTRVLLDERDIALWRAVNELSDLCVRLLRVLMANPRPSYPAVSAALDMPVGSIGPTRQRCLRRLRELLAADDLFSGTRSGAEGSRS
jgi:hypothetical protein